MLRLRLGVPEVIAPLYNTCFETGTDELGPAQDAAVKLRTTQISAQESGLRQVGMLHMRAVQERLREVSAHQPCVGQDGIAHIAPD
jgi:hypothetical protein